MALPLISPAGSEAHEPELRRVTVLFADIQGSTALIQDLDPEDAAGLIDPALHAMIDAAERFDGVVSHRGDGIMAIFGAPSVSEDHGIRACLAALTMRDALTGGAASAGVQTTAVGAVRGVAKVDRRARAVQLRIGIHVGDVVFRPVRIGGAWTQDAVGIAVHVAARLEQSAAPGTICLSGAVVQATSGFVRVGRLDAMMVKGVDAPIDRYELIEADRTANRWTVRAARGLTRFAGRQAELAVLDAALAEDGRRVVHIHGAAGLGKSRVLHEFLETSAARSCHVVALVGDHHRRFVPFHPVASWLRIWLDIRPIENPVEARAELARKLAALDPMPSLAPDLLARVLNIAEAEPWTGAIGALAAVDFGTPIAALLRALAAGRRTILICEDADSFDPATQDLVNDALARLAADDVLAVTASRVPVRFAALTVAETRIISLGPLSPEDAAGMLGGIDPRFRARPALAATIIDKAAGNPLFIEEVAAAMPATAATVPLDALADIPDRVEALIADRLARLPRPLRRLVELGAVIGVDVPMPLLALLADVEPAALYPLLLRLQAEQIMYETGKYPDPVFSFKHALTRDVAYSAMLAARRRGHHARIVALLEAEGEAARARNIDDLSMHALHARLWEPAVRYLQQTARQAVGRSANRSALSALSRARDVAAKELPDTAEAVRMRLDLLLNLQVLVLHSGHYSDVLPIMDEAETLAHRLVDGVAQARILAGRVHVLNVLGQLDEAIALGTRIRGAAREAGDLRQMISAGFFTGQSYFNAGKLRDAERTLSENLREMAEMADTTTPLAIEDAMAVHNTMRTLRPQALGTRAMARVFLGDFVGAQADAAASASLAAATRRPYDRIFAAAAEAFVALQRRRPDDAARLFRAALALSDEAEITQLRPPALAGLGHALLMGNDLGTASETLTASHRLARGEQRWMFQLFAATGLALAGLRLGEPDLARGFADEAVGLAERYGFAAFRVPALRAQGLALALTTGQEKAGFALLTSAIAAAEALALPAEIAHGHAALAVARAPEAARHRAEADRRYAALGLQHWANAQRAAQAAGLLPYL